MQAGAVDIFARHPRVVRTALYTLAVALSVGLYYYVTEFYDPSRNLWPRFATDKVRLFAGEKDGIYHALATSVLRDAEDLLEPVGDAPFGATSGGFENAVKVMATAKSVGFLQEDTLRKDDIIRSNVRFVVPLYLERMHIIYNRQRLLAHAAESETLTDDEKPVLLAAIENNEVSVEMPEFRKIFSHSTISSGQPGSGTQVFSSFLFNLLDISARNDLGLPLPEAVDALTQPGSPCGIVFYMAGLPVDRVKNALDKSPELGLINIRPATVELINREFGRSLRPTTFEDRYGSEWESTTTFGSYAYLICSRDLPDASLREFLEQLEAIRKADPEKDYLNEHAFFAAFDKEHSGKWHDRVRAWVLFLTSVAATSAAVMAFLVWFISGWKNARLLQNITDIYVRALPTNVNLRRVGDSPLERPVIDPEKEQQTDYVNELSKGISALMALLEEVRATYSAGGLTSTHYRTLRETAWSLISVLRTHVARRISGLVTRHKLNDGATVIEDYFIGGYLSREDFRWLRQSANNQL